MNAVYARGATHELVYRVGRFYMRPRISIKGSVRPSVGRSVRNLLFSKLKNEGFSSCMLPKRPRYVTEK